MLRKPIIFELCRLALVLTAAFALRAQGPPNQPVNRGALLSQDFEQRVTDYLKVRKAVEAGMPKLKPTGSPAEIAEHERELARRIREARPRARQGDIFTPEIGAEFRHIIEITMRGGDAARIKQSLKSAEPVQLRLGVNDTYPASVPLQSTPPALLLNLPKLPAQVEYRVVGHNLLLRDVGANLIVDWLPAAIP